MSKKIRYGSVCSGVEAASLAWKDLGWKCVFVSEIEPFPCAVLNQKFGASRPINDCSNESWNRKNKELPEYDGTGIPNEGDFTKIGGKYKNQYDLLVGGTPCFPAGAFVLTADGYKPIEDISVGEYVLTDNMRLKKVVRKGRKIADNIVEVKIEGRPSFEVTSNHPFQIAEELGNKVTKQEIGKSAGKYATLLKTDMLSNTEIYHGELKEIANLTKLSENDCCVLIGWYLSYGTGNLYLIGNDNYSGPENLNKFNSYFKGKLEYKIKPGNGKNEYIIVFDTDVKNWLIRNFSESLRIPLWIYGLSNELKDFIKSGFLSSRFCNSDKESFSVFYEQNLYGLIDLFGNRRFDIVPVKNNQVSLNFYAVDSYNFFENTDRYFAKIEYVKKIEKREIVYNIEVEDDHTYIANGIRVWNCQDASVAGKRKGLVEGSRSKLAFDFVKLAYESRVRWLVWENVPGVFSCNNGNDFAAFLSSFAGWNVTVPSGGWKSAGIVTNATNGNFGLAWRVFDSQYVRTQRFPFAVPQRRRRVFVVGYFGDWRRAAEVLFECKGMYGDIVPCRKTRKEIAKDVRDCIEKSMQSIEIYGTDGYGNCGIENGKCNGTEYIGSDDPVLNAICFASAGFGQKIESDVASTISTNHDDRVTGNNAALILERKTENNTKQCSAVFAIDGDKLNKKERKGGSGLGINEDGVSYTLTAKDVHAIAYNSQNDIEYKYYYWRAQAVRAKEIKNGTSPTLPASLGMGGPNTTTPILIHERKDDIVESDDFCVPLDLRNATRNPEKKDFMNRQGVGVGENGEPIHTITSAFVPGVCWKSTVRRLLPIECERLMGFPDNHTKIKWNGKSEDECIDGPRYKACGNSFCVNVVQWIGEQIQRVEDEIQKENEK